MFDINLLSAILHGCKIASKKSLSPPQFVGNSETHLEAHIKGKSHAKKAGLPAPPPGPAAQPPSAEKKRKPYRFNPYFKSRDRATSSSSDTGGFYQTTRIPQVGQVDCTCKLNKKKNSRLLSLRKHL